MSRSDNLLSFDQARTLTVPEPTQEALRKSKIFKNPEAVNYYRSVFDQWDQNKDGYISIDELERLISANEHIKLSKRSLAILYSRFDSNQDNQLDFEEFLEMINNPRFKNIFKKIALKYLKFVDVPKSRQTLILRRTVTNTGVYETEITFRWYKIFMLTISVLQIVLFYTNYAYINETEERGPIAKALYFNPEKKMEFYRYFTYMLVHNNQDKGHLYANVILQIGAGIPLEMVHGWRIIVIYVIGGLGGSLTHYVLDSGGLKGASAGVYAFYTAHVATVILNWKEMVHPIFKLLVFIILICFDLLYPLIQTELYGQSKVSNTAHLGGAVVGLFLGMCVLRNLVVKRYETVICYVCAVVFLIYMVTMVTLNIVT